MGSKCPACGKTFEIMYKDLWAYKVGSAYLCSWSCLQEYKNAGYERRKCWMLPEDVKEKAIQTAIDGGNPYEVLAPYTKNVKGLWGNLKQSLKKKDPERYASIPDLRTLKKAEKEEPKKAEPVKTEPAKAAKPAEKPKASGQPERMKITKPLAYDNYTVCCIENSTFGRFYWDRDHNHLDWTTAEGEEVSFMPEGWRMFLEELPKAAKILGVEL